MKKHSLFLTSCILLLSAILTCSCGKKNNNVEYKTADKPLFIDPVYNGSTDPMVCFNPTSGTYYMYYTSRRSNVQGLNGIESVHGSPIGIAESKDGGATWEYIGCCNIDYHPDENPTYWAPEVIYNDGLFHMYLTYVPGIFSDWSHPRDIVHLTSKNGIDWTTESVLDLAVRKVIDACVIQLPNGKWRLWYNNETDNKSIYYAESDDLYNWTDMGKVDIDTVGEGPNVFFWNDKYYMIVDEWKGISIFSSDDALNWTKQTSPYLVSGIDGVDGSFGNHADVEVVGNHAYMFYFSAIPAETDPETGTKKPRRGSAVYVTELKLSDDGTVTCDVTEPCLINMSYDKNED